MELVAPFDSAIADGIVSLIKCDRSIQGAVGGYGGLAMGAGGYDYLSQKYTYEK